MDVACSDCKQAYSVWKKAPHHHVAALVPDDTLPVDVEFCPLCGSSNLVYGVEGTWLVYEALTGLPPDLIKQLAKLWSPHLGDNIIFLEWLKEQVAEYAQH